MAQASFSGAGLPDVVVFDLQDGGWSVFVKADGGAHV
jgi:hypothetical protein